MKAYEGNEKYIFVSYSHADSKTVIPIIDTMQKAGFRIWYDRGLEAGSEWPANIEAHINNCAHMLVFISPASVDSINCRNEINYALMIKKPMLVIYLEETELKQGMNLQLNSIQSLFRYRHATDQTFLEELIDAKTLQSCRAMKADGIQIEDTPINPSHIGTNCENEEYLKALDSGNRIRIKQSRSSNPAAISAVSVTASPWQAMNGDQANNINKSITLQFYARFIKACTEESVRKVVLMIFDRNDKLIFEKHDECVFKPGNDGFLIGWAAPQITGMKRQAGNYTALLWIDNSSIFEYRFSLIPSITGYIIRENANVSSDDQGSDTSGEIDAIAKKLTYPKIFRRHLLISFLCFFTFCFYAVYYDSVVMNIICVVMWIGSIVAFIDLFKLTKRNLIPSSLWTSLALTIGYVFFGVFIFFAAIYTVINKKKWQTQILTHKNN